MTSTHRCSLSFSLILASAFLVAIHGPITAVQSASETAATPQKLTIVWTSGDPDVAHRMVLMYGHAAIRNKWFEEVRIIIWGPSSRLAAADKEIQSKLAAMKADGVVVEACIVCADSYGVTKRLQEQGIDVKPMGLPLSDTIKDSTIHLVTF